MLQWLHLLEVEPFMPDDDAPPSKPVPVTPYQTPAPRNVLAYRQPVPGGTVTVRRCANAAEAHVYVAALAASGIEAFVFNQNVNALGAYFSSVDVEVQVRKEDAALATDALAREPGSAEDLEPAEDPAGEPSGVAAADAAGREVKLAVVAAYESPR